MTRTRFTKADLKRAVSALTEAGVKVGKVRIDADGAIEVFATELVTEEQRDKTWDDFND